MTHVTTSERQGSLHWPEHSNELPRDIFSREDIYELEMERLFGGPIWHPVAHAAELPEPGCFKTWDLGRVPLIISHGQDGRIRTFVNACAHRGTALETKPYGRNNVFHCPYHRWTYKLSGELKNAPRDELFPADFRKEDYGLRSVRTENFCGIIFATLHPETPPLAEFLGELAPFLQKLMRGDGRMVMLGAQRTRLNCNWKYYADQEGFHAPLLHAAFKLLGWQGGSGQRVTTAYGHQVYEYETTPYKDNHFLKDPSVVTSGKNGGLVGKIAPATTFSDHLDTLTLRFMRPRGVSEVEVHYTYFAPADEHGEALTHRVRQSSNLLGPSGLISLEDGAVFKRLAFSTHAGGQPKFLAGVGRPGDPAKGNQNDEAGNLLQWATYRRLMGL
jgi:anthranilate 1,2-dioxygenase large subunit